MIELSDLERAILQHEARGDRYSQAGSEAAIRDAYLRLQELGILVDVAFVTRSGVQVCARASMTPLGLEVLLGLA
ncbi:hypothetical protein GCM10027519_07560 [Kineococcus endophyticus]